MRSEPQRVVLFADNDAQFLDARAEWLEDAGYRVLKASGLEQARRLLAEARIHLAILDVRLVDDQDERDISGLLLAQHPAYRAIPKVILTDFPTVQAVKSALAPVLDGRSPAVDFISKKDSPQSMV